VEEEKWVLYVVELGAQVKTSELGNGEGSRFGKSQSRSEKSEEEEGLSFQI
jgi:hypothetical protein